MTIIRYAGRPAAWVSTAALRLLPWVEALEPDHPIRRFVTCMGLFAQDVQRGDIRGPYRDARAEHFARCVLIPEEVFLGCDAETDAALAQRFAVPLEQIEEKCRDLAVVGDAPPELRQVGAPRLERGLFRASDRSHPTKSCMLSARSQGSIRPRDW